MYIQKITKLIKYNYLKKYILIVHIYQFLCEDNERTLVEKTHPDDSCDPGPTLFDASKFMVPLAQKKAQLRERQ